MIESISNCARGILSALISLTLLLTISSGHAEPSPSGEVSPSAPAITVKANQRLLLVKGMVCGMCVQGITKQLTEIDGVKNVEINLESGTVLVTAVSPEKIPADQRLRDAVDRAGYEVQNIHHASN